MVRGVYIDRAPTENTTLKSALTRYLAEISPTKSPGSPRRETIRAKPLFEQLGDYAIIAITPDLVAQYHDDRLALGKSNNTVRLEFALLSHLFTIAIKEWRMGLIYNPVAVKPSAGAGRNRRLLPEEERKLPTACDEASNPMLGWMVRLAVSTGMRAGEIQSLCRSQVDLTKRVVRLGKTKNGTARIIPLTRLAVQVLQEALAHPIRPMNTELAFWGEPGRDGHRRPYEDNPAWRRAL